MLMLTLSHDSKALFFPPQEQVSEIFLRGLLSGLEVDPVRTFLSHLQFSSKCTAKLHYEEWYESFVWEPCALPPSLSIGTAVIEGCLSSPLHTEVADDISVISVI